jgi:hypothetical protein
LLRSLKIGSTKNQAAFNPPSTGIAVPVTNEAASLAKNKMTAAISDGSPYRPNGTMRVMAWRTASGSVGDKVRSMAKIISVDVGEGQTAFTRIFCEASSADANLVMPTTACLLAL